jgi:hypothetical protein
MTSTLAPQQMTRPRHARHRLIVVFGYASIVLVTATPLTMLAGAPVAAILALPVLALICLMLAIELTARDVHDTADNTPPWIHVEAARGLWELEHYANSGSAR